ncbi:hypothetical protein DL93DRAFT_2081807 [Clavulina sp. PMI_390]|nr:hypothetical protein DL93DRAFT_2081807 [Clavulina sp. PMI_390]
MHLYHLSLQPPTAINASIVGNFSGGRRQEILVSHGTRLRLLRLDADSGELSTVLEQDTFGSVRSMAAFRLTGGTKDYAILGSDAGRIVIIEYDEKNNAFNKLHQETFGKSGARRIVPGQYLAVDNKGRAVMISAMEKSKLVYILNRDAAAALTISSPLEAHKNHAIIHHITALDVGFENPLFAALEVDYTESDRDPTGEAFYAAEKMLTYYELDLGLNHVVRKWSEPVDPRANLLVPVPGGQSATTNAFDGPSGVLVCCEDHIMYRHMERPTHRVPIPRRNDPLRDPSRGLIITSSAMHKIKGGSFFFILQSEDGDLYKVTLEHEGEDVTELRISYFDTVPVASSLSILKTGYLFISSEFGNHHVYKFNNLDEREPVISSTDYPSNGMAQPSSPLPPSFFTPRPPLAQLTEQGVDRPDLKILLVNELSSLAPVIDSHVANLKESDGEAPQIFTISGRGARSSFRMLRHGIEAPELMSSELPGTPNAVWTAKLRDSDEFDAYIVLSFINGTLVLSIGQEIEEVTDSGFLSSTPTLAVQQIGYDGLVQVHPHGIRHVLGDRRVNEWRVPPGTTILAATTNKRQIVAALSSTELVYFELDLEGQLNEYQDRKPLGSRVMALSVGEVPEGRQRTPYLAVGCEDQTVRIISLDPDSTLEVISLQALTAIPQSILIAEMKDASLHKSSTTMFVNIGLSNGVLLRTILDPVQGTLTDTRSRFLGTRPVRLVRLSLSGTPAVLALSSKAWLNYTYQELLRFAPLITDYIEHAWSFSAAVCPDGIITINNNVLRIITTADLGQKLEQRSLPLTYTPRQLLAHPSEKLFYVVESEHRVLGKDAAEAKLGGPSKLQEFNDERPPEEFGYSKAEAGQWASCLRIIDPMEWSSLPPIHFTNNEAAFCATVVPFSERPDQLHLVVGLARDTRLAPRSCTTGLLRTYLIKDEGRVLEHLHETEIDDVPLALMPFRGRLLAGVGTALRIYDIGKKKLLRKCENKTFTSPVVKLRTQGSRIIVGTAQDSVFFVVYKAAENRLLVFADDTAPRWVTSMCMVDYETVAAGDKFGNVFLNRLPPSVTPSVDDDPTGSGIMHEKAILNGAPNKSQLMAHFHVGDIVTSIHRVSLVPGAREVLLFTGLHGTIGMLVPFVSKEDIDFMNALEQHLRTEGPGGMGAGGQSLVGRDQMAYRGYYVPVKAVVDGDLCERFARLPATRQSAIAGELDRTVGEVLKKLDNLRVTASGM